MNSTPGDDEREFDEQVQFFLDRQEQILEWSNLARLAHKAAREKVAASSLGTSDLGESWLAGDALVGRALGGPVLFRAMWCVTTPDIPDVGIDLTCDKPEIVDPSGLVLAAGKPFVGVLCSKTTLAGVRIEAELREKKLPTAGTGWTAGSDHLVYRYMTDKFWFKHLGLWKATLVKEMLLAAERYRAAIDAAVDVARAG